MKSPDQELIPAGEKAPSWEKFNKPVKMMITDKRSVASRLAAEAVRSRLRGLNISLDRQGSSEDWGWPIKRAPRSFKSPHLLLSV